jgi:CRISPR/Cas system CSM-associated protein Csm3 (group 7 of RAMP superfamily)
MSARWNEHREISRHIIVKGELTLLTPARFGGGEEGVVTSMPILRDPATNLPLLSGSSIAGAMRAYVRERILDYETAEPENESMISQKLFGEVLGEDAGRGAGQNAESRESYLVINDALAKSTSTEFRPGVKINPKTRTADFIEDKGGQLYDMELLEAGTRFDLDFELDLPENKDLQRELLQGFAIALTGFEKGEISMGTRKRRGFGECEVMKWDVHTYDLKTPKELVAWISGEPGTTKTGNTIAELLEVTQPLPDKRNRFTLDAEFRLGTSLLIRSGGSDTKSPDMTHLRSSHRDKKNALILSGTSLAGAMRARAQRIANTMLKEDEAAKKLVSELFGPATDEFKQQSERKDLGGPFASRLTVRERAINGRSDLIQTRIRIDRFTGGTYPGALFEQQPVTGGDQSRVTVSMELRKPTQSQVGLLLHLLRDLWTGDLPLGGEASVGRGRLEGVKANLCWYHPGQNKEEWHITPEGESKLLVEGDLEKLNAYANGMGGSK